MNCFSACSVSTAHAWYLNTSGLLIVMDLLLDWWALQYLYRNESLMWFKSTHVSVVLKLSPLNFRVWLLTLLSALLWLQVSVFSWTGGTRTGQVFQHGLPRVKKSLCSLSSPWSKALHCSCHSIPRGASLTDNQPCFPLPSERCCQNCLHLVLQEVTVLALLSASLSSAGCDLYWGPVCSCTLLFPIPAQLSAFVSQNFYFCWTTEWNSLVSTISPYKSLIKIIWWGFCFIVIFIFQQVINISIYSVDFWISLTRSQNAILYDVRWLMGSKYDLVML